MASRAGDRDLLRAAQTLPGLIAVLIILDLHALVGIVVGDLGWLIMIIK